ncbi:cysteine-rich protein 2-binding protein-like, partial [Plakobranchus ocellatus]
MNSNEAKIWQLHLLRQDTVALSLYHLQKTHQGKCGFFHWRLQICAFIDKHWRCLFSHHRKKTTLWLGTVGGTLSSGCPDLFTSGASQVEMGFWRLTQLKPPLPQAEKKRLGPKKKVVSDPPVYLNPEERSCRKRKDNALTAAMELKEKRIATSASSKRKSQLGMATSTAAVPIQQHGGKGKSKKKKAGPESPAEPVVVAATAAAIDPGDVSDSDMVCGSDADDVASVASSVTMESSMSSSLVSYSQEDLAEPVDSSSNTRLDFLNAIKLEADDGDSDLDIDIGTMVPSDMPDCRPGSPDVSSALSYVMDTSASSAVAGKSPVAKNQGNLVHVKQEMQDPMNASLEETNERDPVESESSGLEEESEDDSDDEVSDEEEASEASEKALQSDVGGVPKRKRGRPRKGSRADEVPPGSPPPRLKRISLFEEKELLQKLNDVAKHQTLRPHLAQLRRKLICNQTNREFGLPVFDLDSQLEKIGKPQSTGNLHSFQDDAFLSKISMKSASVRETRDLDRFMMHDGETKSKCRTYTTFLQRLVGLEDHELKPTVSPYTTRVLLPFIWRNYNPSKKPLKLKLLQEIQAYPY